MHVTDFERLYDYSCWANQKLFGVIAGLTPEQFTEPVAGSYGSIRNTLVHVLSAEWGWLERCGGPPRGERLKADDFPSLASVVELWSRVEVQMRSYLANLKDEDLEQDVEFTLGPVGKHVIARGHLLQHAVMHAVHHRGQVAVLVRALGHTPGDFDVLFYDIGRSAVVSR